MEENPLNTEAKWEHLSPLAQSMILFIIHSDSKWLKNLMEGEVTFIIHNRTVHSMTPAPDLKPGHGLPHVERRRL